MTERVVYVTKAQRDAAQLIVERSARAGRPVRPAVVKIAEASMWTDRTSNVGQFQIAKAGCGTFKPIKQRGRLCGWLARLGFDRSA